jgi:hypothetical protein
MQEDLADYLLGLEEIFFMIEPVLMDSKET